MQSQFVLSKSITSTVNCIRSLSQIDKVGFEGMEKATIILLQTLGTGAKKQTKNYTK